MFEDEPTHMPGTDEVAGPGALVIIHAASSFILWLVLVLFIWWFQDSMNTKNI